MVTPSLPAASQSQPYTAHLSCHVFWMVWWFPLPLWGLMELTDVPASYSYPLAHLGLKTWVCLEFLGTSHWYQGRSHTPHSKIRVLSTTEFLFVGKKCLDLIKNSG